MLRNYCMIEPNRGLKSKNKVSNDSFEETLGVSEHDCIRFSTHHFEEILYKIKHKSMPCLREEVMTPRAERVTL